MSLPNATSVILLMTSSFLSWLSLTYCYFSNSNKYICMFECMYACVYLCFSTIRALPINLALWRHLSLSLYEEEWREKEWNIFSYVRMLSFSSLQRALLCPPYPLLSGQIQSGGDWLKHRLTSRMSDTTVALWTFLTMHFDHAVYLKW